MDSTTVNAKLVVGNDFIAFITDPGPTANKQSVKAVRKRISINPPVVAAPVVAAPVVAAPVVAAPVVAAAPNSPVRPGVRANLFGNPRETGDNTPQRRVDKRHFDDYIRPFGSNEDAPVKRRIIEAFAKMAL